MSPHKDWQCDAVPNRHCRLGDAQTQVPPVPHMRQSLASPAMRLLFRSPPVAFCIRASRLLLVGELSSATWLHIASPKLRASRRGRGARLESALSLLMLQPGYVDGMACGWHSVSAWRHAHKQVFEGEDGGTRSAEPRRPHGAQQQRHHLRQLHIARDSRISNGRVSSCCQR